MRWQPKTNKPSPKSESWNAFEARKMGSTFHDDVWHHILVVHVHCPPCHYTKKSTIALDYADLAVRLCGNFFALAFPIDNLETQPHRIYHNSRVQLSSAASAPTMLCMMSEGGASWDYTQWNLTLFQQRKRPISGVPRPMCHHHASAALQAKEASMERVNDI